MQPEVVNRTTRPRQTDHVPLSHCNRLEGLLVHRGDMALEDARRRPDHQGAREADVRAVSLRPRRIKNLDAADGVDHGHSLAVQVHAVVLRPLARERDCRRRVGRPIAVGVRPGRAGRGQHGNNTLLLGSVEQSEAAVAVLEKVARPAGSPAHLRTVEEPLPFAALADANCGSLVDKLPADAVANGERRVERRPGVRRAEAGVDPVLLDGLLPRLRFALGWPRRPVAMLTGGCASAVAQPITRTSPITRKLVIAARPPRTALASPRSIARR